MSASKPATSTLSPAAAHLPDGPVRAMEITTIVAAGFLAGGLVLVRLLAKRPRLNQVQVK